MQPDIFTARFTVHEVKEVCSRAQAPYMEVSVSEMEENCFCILYISLLLLLVTRTKISVVNKKYLFTCSQWYRQSRLP